MGFRRKPGEQVFGKALAEGIDGSLDVTSVTRGAELAVSLGVGLQVPEAERLISQWLDRPQADRPSYSCNVGYLRPEKNWIDVRFRHGEPFDEGLALLMNWVNGDALPFLEGHASLRGVAEVFSGTSLPVDGPSAAQRLPILYALAGDDAAAAEALSRIAELASDSNSSRVFIWRAYLDGFRGAFPAIGLSRGESKAFFYRTPRAIWENHPLLPLVEVPAVPGDLSLDFG